MIMMPGGLQSTRSQCQCHNWRQLVNSHYNLALSALSKGQKMWPLIMHMNSVLLCLLPPFYGSNPSKSLPRREISPIFLFHEYFALLQQLETFYLFPFFDSGSRPLTISFNSIFFQRSLWPLNMLVWGGLSPAQIWVTRSMWPLNHGTQPERLSQRIYPGKDSDEKSEEWYGLCFWELGISWALCSANLLFPLMLSMAIRNFSHLAQPSLRSCYPLECRRRQ